MGLQTNCKGSRIYAVLKGALDGGLNVAHSADVLPSEERVNGKHISEYAKKLNQDRAKYEKQFSKILKSGIEPEKIHEHVKEIKNKIGKIGALK